MNKSYIYCADKIREWFDEHPYAGEVHKVVLGKSGRRWFYIPDHPSSASMIHVEANPRENAAGYGGFRGYGGDTLTFNTNDGTVDVTGPWHSNPNKLYADTGVDLREKTVTMGIIGKQRSDDGEIQAIIYQDESPTVGRYSRIKSLANEVAERDGQDVFFCMASYGGGTASAKTCLFMEKTNEA